MAVEASAKPRASLRILNSPFNVEATDWGNVYRLHWCHASDEKMRTVAKTPQILMVGWFAML
jgi:hypothetical protein